jgi:hypothetical protein
MVAADGLELFAVLVFLPHLEVLLILPG